MPTANLNAHRSNAKSASPTYTADMVRTYLHEIGRVPLLTHEQEIVLGKQVQRMMQLLDLKAHLANSLDRDPRDDEWAAQAEVSVAELQDLLRKGHRAKQK